MSNKAISLQFHIKSICVLIFAYRLNSFLNRLVFLSNLLYGIQSRNQHVLTFPITPTEYELRYIYSFNTCIFGNIGRCKPFYYYKIGKKPCEYVRLQYKNDIVIQAYHSYKDIPGCIDGFRRRCPQQEG